MKVMRLIAGVGLVGLVLVAGVARAQDAGADDAAPAAREVVDRYLQRVKAKRWTDAQKMVHPKTLEVIAERKKRLGKEDHPLAPQAYEKAESFLKDYRIAGVKPGPKGTIVVETSEDNFQVQEKGLAEGDVASYLVGRYQGVWYVVDKKRGGEAFTPDAVKYGYKGYFDKPEGNP
jgi:hypothetical protein